jgi:hypothetical protein
MMRRAPYAPLLSDAFSLVSPCFAYRWQRANGRTGTMHAWEQEGIPPDIQIVAKGLGGGYQPIGGILIGKRIIDAFRAGSGAFMHGHTYEAPTPSPVPPRSPCRKSSATTTSSTTCRPWASA